VKVGTTWPVYVSQCFGEDPDGNNYGLVATDLQSDFLLLFLMPDKSAESVLAALDELRAFVRGTKPGVSVEVFLGDNDTAWAVTGQGDTRTTAAVSRWLAALPEEQGAGFAFSAPYTHQHVDVERSMWLLYAFMNANLRRARFSGKIWSDALRAAVWQVNALPGLRVRRAAGRSRYERYYGYELDKSLMIGIFGTTCYIHKEGVKVNSGLANAVPGYYICPSSSSTGWLVRQFSSLRISVRYHVKFLDNRNYPIVAAHPQIVALGG
jgi:hypothetical protein